MLVFHAKFPPKVESRLRRILQGLPELAGAPIHLEFRTDLADSHGSIHAGAFLRERRILFDATLASQPAEFARIFVHELFHFVWLRLGNPLRWSWEEVLVAEFHRRARGELGWSAEWRKRALPEGAEAERGRLWREYACESFCDTAAWRYARLRRHPEFTIAPRHRLGRSRWFTESVETRRMSV